MDKTRLREEFFLELGRCLERFGFQPVKSRQAFILKEPDRSSVFHISVINHSADFDVTADVAVRFHAVEGVVVGAELGNLQGSGQKRWTIRQPGDIPEAVAEIQEWFAAVAQPFFGRFADLNAIRSMLEENGPQARLVCPLEGARKKMLEDIRRSMNG